MVDRTYEIDGKFIELLHLPEKAVVYNFMDAVCKASTDHVPTRTMVPNLVEKTSIKPQFPKELYHQQRAKSARSQRVTERPFIPPRPKSVGSMRYRGNVL